VSIVKKTPSEVYCEIESLVANVVTGIVTINILIRNPYCANGSLGVLQFIKEGDELHSECTLAEDQDIDVDSIELTGRNQRIALYWDAAIDVGIAEAFEGVSVRVAFYDEESQAGEMSDYTTDTIDLNFTIGNVDNVTKPKVNDPYLDFEFFNPPTIRPSLVHFLLEVATDTLFADIVATFDSSASQTEWSFDGGAFPSIGIPGTDEWKITCEDESLPLLEDGDYYYRITPTATNVDLEATFINDEDGNYILDEDYNYVIE